MLNFGFNLISNLHLDRNDNIYQLLACAEINSTKETISTNLCHFTPFMDDPRPFRLVGAKNGHDEVFSFSPSDHPVYSVYPLLSDTAQCSQIIERV